MSDRGRYRKVYARLWRHPGFGSLSEGEKVLALYLLTGPQTNRLGLYVLSVATAAEDLRTVSETVKKRLVNVCQAFGWLFDGRSRVLYIPSWFKWNPPENANVVKGSLKDLNEIPPSGLVDAFARNLEHLPQTLHETFIEGLQQRLPRSLSIQEQYQYQDQEQKQEHKPKTRSSIEDKHVEVAREAVRLTSNRSTLDELVDAFGHVAQREKLDFTRGQAQVAINLVLTEHGKVAL